MKTPNTNKFAATPGGFCNAIVPGGLTYKHKNSEFLKGTFYKNISEREMDIIECIVKGRTDKETADCLDISINTARTHMRNIRKKMGFNHRTEIAIFALKHNIKF